MNQFKILAHGEEFNVDFFLETSSLKPSTVWRKGQTIRGRREPTTSGFEVMLGDGLSLDIYEQQRIAIDYLGNNFNDLKACAESPGMKHYMIFIQQRMEISLSVVGFCTNLSRQLLCLTTAIDMDAMTYVDLKRLDRQECGWPSDDI